MAPSATSPAMPEALVSSFLANVPDNVYFKDRDSRIIAVSVSFARYFGAADPASMVGKTDFDLFDQAHALSAYEDEQRIMRTGVPLLGKLEKEVWSNGLEKWVLTSKMVLRDSTGAIVGTFGISKDVTETKRTEEALETARKELMDAARLAGMAEVATGVLHNVGNVLNSLNVSNSLVTSGVRALKPESLAKVVALIEEHRSDLGAFFASDPKGKLIPEFLSSFARNLADEQARLLTEIEAQQQNIDHIKEIVTMQQAYATMVGVIEPLSPATLMEDAVRMNWGALLRHQVTLVRCFEPAPAVIAERGKVLQILVNLIRNAKYALDEGAPKVKTLTVALESGAPGMVRFIVSDNGIGIAPENFSRLFGHGFTTRKEGHGFGLHSSALAAKEMHGSLTAFSDGLGKGARFVLELPVAKEQPAAPVMRLAAAAA